jgi:hypothetical protein
VRWGLAAAEQPAAASRAQLPPSFHGCMRGMCGMVGTCHWLLKDGCQERSTGKEATY